MRLKFLFERFAFNRFAFKDKMRNDLRVNEDFFVENEKLVVDESKRPGKPKDAAELFGVEGSFKKLSID